MAVNLKGRSFLTLKDFTPAEIRYLLDLSHDLKAKKRAGILGDSLKGKNVVLLFEKTSTRTRCAFECGAAEEGAHVTFLTNSQMGKKESIEDTAKVLGRMYDGIEFRGFKQSTVEELAKHAGVPVWNGLTDEWHPTQMLADYLTVQENFGRLEGLTLVYCGDGRNNVANSLLVTGAILGVNVHIFSPKELFPEKEIVELAEGFAKESGAHILITEDADEAVKGADVLYTDVWVSMGEEDKFAERVALLKPYQVNMDLIKKADNEDLIFLHCLPAFHDTNTVYGKDVAEKFGVEEMEVTDEVFRSKYARHFDQAENRMHTIKAVMAATLGNLYIPKV